MSSNLNDQILGMPRRPRIADASVSTILWAIAGGLLAGPVGALVGGTAGNAIANQRQPLEMAIREYLTKRGLEVVFFYPAPRSVKVSVSYGPNSYWTLESVMPDDLDLPPEDGADWLYGNLITNELPSQLWDLFGSKGIASEVLSGKRGISKAHARALADYFHVSAELFI